MPWRWLSSLFNSIGSFHPTGTSGGAGAATTGATAGSTSGRTGTEGGAGEGDRKQRTWEISDQIPSVLKIFSGDLLHCFHCKAKCSRDKKDKDICILSSLWDAVKDDRLMTTASEIRNSPILLAVSLIFYMMLCEIQNNMKWVFTHSASIWKRKILYLHNWWLPHLSSENVHLKTNGNTYQRPTVKHWTVEKRKEGLDKPVGGDGEGIEDITSQLTGTTNQNQRNSQSLNQQPGSLQGTDLGLLHICDRYVAWSSYRTLRNRDWP